MGRDHLTTRGGGKPIAAGAAKFTNPQLGPREKGRQSGAHTLNVAAPRTSAKNHSGAPKAPSPKR